MFRILHDGGSYRVLEAEQGRPVHYRIDGQIHEREPGTELLAVIERMHTSGLGRGLVELDIHNLAFVNSVGLKALVRWVQLLQGATSLERYRLRIQPDFEHGWQRTSLRDLARLAGPVLELMGEERDEPASVPNIADLARNSGEPSASEPGASEPSAGGLTLGSRLK